MSRNDGVGNVKAQLRHKKRATDTPTYPSARTPATTATSTPSARSRLTMPERCPCSGWARFGTAEPVSGTRPRRATCAASTAMSGGSCVVSSGSTGTSCGGRRQRSRAVLVRAQPAVARGPPAGKHPVHEVGEGLIGVHAPGPPLPQAFGRDRTGGCPDDLRQVDAVDDVLGESDEVQPVDDRVELEVRGDAVEVDASLDEFVEVEPVEDLVDVEVGGEAVEVDASLDELVEVEPVEDLVDVEVGGEAVEVDASLDELVEVDPVEDEIDHGGDDATEQALQRSGGTSRQVLPGALASSAHPLGEVDRDAGGDGDPERRRFAGEAGQARLVGHRDGHTHGHV